MREGRPPAAPDPASAALLAAQQSVRTALKAVNRRRFLRPVCALASRAFLLDWPRPSTEAQWSPSSRSNASSGSPSRWPTGIADAEIASEIYSTAGEFDLLMQGLRRRTGTDIGHFVNEKVQIVPGIQDTRTIITFEAVLDAFVTGNQPHFN